MAIKILVNGIDRTDKLFYGSTMNFNVMRSQRGTCTIPFIIEPGDSYAPRINQAVEIFDPEDTRVWCGTVDSVAVQWFGDADHHVIVITGTSLEQLLDTAEVDKLKYTGVPCGDAVEDVFDQSGVTGIGLGTINDGPDVESLEITNVASGIDQLANIAGFIWYVDPIDKLLYFHAPRDRVVSFSLESNDVLWETLDWKQSRQDFRNAQVIQLGGVALSPVTVEFTGDGDQTDFTLPSVPQYILTVDLSTGISGRTVEWNPGSAIISITPAPEDESTIRVRYADSGVVFAQVAGPDVGSKTARYTRTKTFTSAGASQEAVAMLQKYALLPSVLIFSTDKPGLQIARKLTIDLDMPAQAAALINGEWLIHEIEGSLIPGKEKKPEPHGHFRYTVHLINTAATAVFQGDGETESFLLPEVPLEVTRIAPDFPEHHLAVWVNGTNEITVTPGLEPGEGMSVDYITANQPDVPSFVDTWEDMTGDFSGTPSVLGGEIESSEAPQTFIRTLTIYDATVRDDAAPHTTTYHVGVGFRVQAVLRKAITEDYVIRINKAGEELITVTIPDTTAVDEYLEFPLVEGSPPQFIPFADKEILTADITASDGQTDADGILQLTVQWGESGEWEQTA